MSPSDCRRPIGRALPLAQPVVLLSLLTLLALLVGATVSSPARATDPTGSAGERPEIHASEGPAEAPPAGSPSTKAEEEKADETPVASEEAPPPGVPGPRAGMPSAIAQFTTAVEDREPIDAVTFVSNDTREIHFFSDLRNLEGHVVTHRWIYSGRTMAEVDFQVRGPRWRVWSTKALMPDWIGDWTVEIVTEDGEVIAAETFTYSAPSS